MGLFNENKVMKFPIFIIIDNTISKSLAAKETEIPCIKGVWKAGIYYLDMIRVSKDTFVNI